MTSYHVNEIFYSLQGEGFYTGVPAVFLRLSGCNRSCPFCDTDHSTSRPMSADEIVAEMLRVGGPCRHAVITGGEPLLQLDAQLIDALHDAGFYIQIETNGTLPVPEGVDWITCSPKEEPWGLDRLNELKVVYQGQDVEAIAERFPALHLYLQPCSGANIPETVEYIKHHPYWRLSLQTHKLIDIP